MDGLFKELKRRNVHRAAAAYVAVGWLLLQLVDVLLEIYGFDAGAVRWLLPALVVGFVPAMVLAWVFEWTPRGLERESAVARREATDPDSAAAQLRRARRSDRIIIVLLALGLVVLAVDAYLLEAETPAVEPPAQSIAVLPFLDLSPAGDQAFFALGVSEELLNLLAQIRGLQVAARTSSFAFQGSAASASAIAEALNVRYLLEGSVRSQDERIRVTAQLIDARSGFHLWSQNFDRLAEDLFDIQEAVAAQVVAAVQPTLLGDVPQLVRTDPAVHRLVLEAEYLAGQSTPATLRQALENFQVAVERDPQYARAWLGRSVVYANLAHNGLIDPHQGFARAEESALTARRLQPDHFGAYDQLAWLARHQRNDLQASARYLEQALRLAPGHPDVVGNAGGLLQMIGRLPAALPLMEYSVERDPLDPNGLYNLGLSYYFADRLDDAEAVFERLLLLAPDYVGARYRLGTVAWRRGEPAAALRHFEQVADPGFRAKGRAIALHALGRQEQAQAALAELIRLAADSYPSEITQVYAQWGDLDRAFEWLERDYEVEGPAGWGEYRLMHLYEPLFGDPRWQAFLERVAASDTQLAAIDFDLSVLPDTLRYRAEDLGG